MMDIMDTEEAVHLVVVGVVAVGAVVFLLAAASGACGCADAFPAARWRKRAQVDDDDDVESSLGGAATLMTYEQAAAAEGAEYSCAICLEEHAGADVVRVLPACGHFFHKECINRWVVHQIGKHHHHRRRCPLCRGALSLPPPLPKPELCPPMPTRTTRPAAVVD